MADNTTPSLEQMLYGNLEKAPAELAADFTAAAGITQAPAANAKLMADQMILPAMILPILLALLKQPKLRRTQARNTR